MDYNELISDKTVPGSIANWLNNSTITPIAPSIVEEGLSWIYRRLRHWRMLTPPTPGIMTAGDDFITIPSDMLQPELLYITNPYQQKITQRTMQDVLAAWAFDGSGNRVRQQPSMYYFDQTALRLDSPPDQAYNYVLIYYQQPAPLATSITNFLTANYSRLLRCAFMAAATEWAKDSGVGSYDRTYWDQMCQVEIDAAQIESDRARHAMEVGAIIL